MRRIIAGFVVGAIVAGGGFAFAGIPEDDGTIRACYAKSNGAVRVIDDSTGGSCRANEEPLAWDEPEPLDLVGGAVSVAVSHTYAEDPQNPCVNGLQARMESDSSGMIQLPVGTYRPVLEGTRVTPPGTEVQVVIHQGFRPVDQWRFSQELVQEPGLIRAPFPFSNFYDVYAAAIVPCSPGGPTASWDGTVTFLRVAD